MDDEFKEHINEFTDDDIKDILKEALKVRIDEKRKKPHKTQLNNALISTIGEFMGCFRLMGYDLDGNPISLVVYKEKIEKSALDNQFMEEIGKFMETRIK